MKDHKNGFTLLQENIKENTTKTPNGFRFFARFWDVESGTNTILKQYWLQIDMILIPE